MGMEPLWLPRYGEPDINKDTGTLRPILGMMVTI